MRLVEVYASKGRLILNALSISLKFFFVFFISMHQYGLYGCTAFLHIPKMISDLFFIFRPLKKGLWYHRSVFMSL